MSSGKQREFKNPVMNWIEYRLPVFSFLDDSIGSNYPTPKNLNYWWNFGSLALVIMVIMIVSGIVLAMHYTPNTAMAFDSVERIMRDVNYGWLIRYLHMNGGSMFFIVVYIHIFRGMYYGSYKEPRELLWIIGVMILLAMMATAFLGYVLPWGQMSFWGATVITNLFSAIPLVGDYVVTLLWGGFTVDNPTLNRFFSLHYLLPFVLVGLVVVHIWALHVHKSNNPLGIDIKNEEQDCIPFHPYFTIKDLFGMGIFMMFFLGFVFFAPDFFGEPDNYIEANPMVTPAHIVPEWYFLPFYAILRAVPAIWFIPAKLAGVVAMGASIVVFIVLPWLDRAKVRSCQFRPIFKQFFWLFVLDCFILGWVGGKSPAQEVVEGSGFTFLHLGQITTVYYFLHIFVIIPLVSTFEKPRPVPESINAAVMASHSGAKAAE